MYVVGNRNLRQILEYQARSQPEKVFLLFEDAQGRSLTLTYREFNEQVNRAANVLLSLGVKKGDRFNLYLPNCPEFLHFWLGGAKIGAVMVPTNPLSTADEMGYILHHSESVLAITVPQSLGAIQSARVQCPRLREVILCHTEEPQPGTRLLSSLLAQSSPELGPSELHPLDEAAMLYTSGTTARPKGVLITHANYIYGAEVVSKHMRLGPEDRHLVVLPLFHGNAQYYSTMTALLVGASLALMERFSASRYFEQARRYEATVGSLFAAPIRMLLAQPQRSHERENRLRLVIFAQNVTEAQVEEWHRRFGAPLCQIYGMTETIGTPTFNPLDYQRKHMSIGMPTLGYQCKVVDEGGQEVPPGTVGQLLVKGEPGWTLMKGYYKNPQATAETLRDGWLYTGDSVYMDQEGYFFFVDRAKDMIKRAGENISASEVERVINTHPKVFDSAVIGVPDPVRDEAVMALVILKEGEQATAQEIIEWCKERLVRFKVPELVCFRRDFPRTSVGKVQKHLLRQEVARGRAGNHAADE
jgi:crotonobetaine/carnitine-CoA ligase